MRSLAQGLGKSVKEHLLVTLGGNSRLRGPALGPFPAGWIGQAASEAPCEAGRRILSSRVWYLAGGRALGRSCAG